MTIVEALGRLLAPDSPWILFVAGLLVLGAAGIGRRLFGSLQRQGARIGRLERELDSEQTRRRQVEAELEAEGIPLPWWPPDGTDRKSSGRPAARAAFPPAGAQEDFPSDPETSLDYARPPVPPIPDNERAAFARHRR